MDDHGFWRDGGSLGLDFVGTAGVRRGELLRRPEDLARWLRETGVAARVSVSAAELDAARALRASMTAVVDAVVRGAASSPAGAAESATSPAAGAGVAVPAAALRAVNAAAAVALPPPQLVPAAGRLVVAPGRPAVAQALAVVARDLVELLGGPLGDRLRECEADDCSGVFVDTSRGGRRRWCSSAGCGNRSRVRAHRAKS